jgi:hypothetical protein
MDKNYGKLGDSDNNINSLLYSDGGSGADAVGNGNGSYGQ